MMGMTHVFIGTMSAVMLTDMHSPRDCLAALMGGALGAVACDMDLGRNSHRSETARAGWLAGSIALACLTADLVLNAGLIRRMQAVPSGTITFGLLGLALLCLWGRTQPHRGATHSILMAALLGICMQQICPPVSIPLMIGMASHLVLDIFNRRPVRLLYPFRAGFCLGICRAEGRVDRSLRTAGLLGTMFALGISIGEFI